MEKDSLEDYDYNDDLNDTFSYERTPSDNQGYDVFFLRNNPEPLIEEFYLYLTNMVKNVDPDSNNKKPYFRLKGTKALLNDQGVKDLVNLLRSFVNSHTVQTNIGTEGLNKFMRFVSDDNWTFIVNSLDDWELEERYAMNIKNTLSSKIELFLRRGLDDKEREHYSQEQKHEYSHHSTGDKKKKRLGIPDAVSKMFSG